MAIQNHNPEQDLKDIRSMMEKSSKFISLSGFSGVFIGVMAILTVTLFCRHYDINPFNVHFDQLAALPKENFAVALGAALFLLLLSLVTATLFSLRRAKKMNVSIWGPATRHFLVNMMLPLGFSLIFCLLLYLSEPDLVVPLSLLLYGMCLFNAGKFTHNAIRSLGIFEMTLGVICLLMMEYHILIWTIGFGVLHVLYGFSMYLRNEK